MAEHEGIPLTNPVLTLVDLASSIDRARLERAVNEADRLDLVDPEALRVDLEAYRGLPGVARLREDLDRRTFRLTDSELERLFLPLAALAGRPIPQTRCRVNGFRVDFLWPGLRLVVETDGLTTGRRLNRLAIGFGTRPISRRGTPRFGSPTSRSATSPATCA